MRLSKIEARIEKLKEIQDIIDDQTGETHLIDELITIEDTIEELTKLVNEAREKAFHLRKTVLDQDLAVVNGVCDFPLSCDARKTCKKKRCNYAVCSNGY